jgi:hypothetical protein
LIKNDLRTFVFRGLMFEAEAETFRRAGIQIGSVSTSAEDGLLRESMAPYGISRRNQGLENGTFVLILFCFASKMKFVILFARRFLRKRGRIGKSSCLQK